MKITSDYIKAANAMRGKQKRKRIVAYVESYDDVFFWRTVLGEFENESRYFEIMPPTGNGLSKGKKKAITQMLAEGGGECLIACVDADYDYLVQGATFSSRDMLTSPYVFHTFAYAIENLQCYAPSLHNVCVMSTLNDHAIFDFKAFLSEFSRIIYPLFVWNIYFYRNMDFHSFSITDFNRVIEMRHFSLYHSQDLLERIAHKVNNKINDLRQRYPGRQRDLDALSLDLANLGVTQDTTYLYIQGHHLFDNVVLPIVDTVCKALRNECESNIRTKAAHVVQRQNELSAYANVQTDTAQMLKKNTGYLTSEPYKRILQSLKRIYL